MQYQVQMIHLVTIMLYHIPNLILPPSGFIDPLRILCTTLTVDLTNKLEVVCHKILIVGFIFERSFYLYYF